MNKLAFILLACIPLLFQPSQAQTIELDKLSLPIESRELADLKLSNSGVGIGTKEVQYTCHRPDDRGAVGFGGIEIPVSDSNAQSATCFYSRNGTSDFQGYTLNLSHPDRFAKILKYLLGEKSKFKLVFDDGKDSEERARVFVSNSNGATYLLLSIANGQGKKSGYMDGVAKGEQALLSSRLGGSFGYYEAFLEFKKHKSPGFGYLEFLRETDSELYKKDNNLK